MYIHIYIYIYIYKHTFSGVVLKPRFPNAFLFSSNDTGAQPMLRRQNIFIYLYLYLYTYIYIFIYIPFSGVTPKPRLFSALLSNSNETIYFKKYIYICIYI